MNDLKVFLERWQATQGEQAPQRVADKVAELLDLLDDVANPKPSDMPGARRIYDSAVYQLEQARRLPALPQATIETNVYGAQRLLLDGEPLAFEIEQGIDVTPVGATTSLVTISIPCEYQVRFRTGKDD